MGIDVLIERLAGTRFAWRLSFTHSGRPPGTDETRVGPAGAIPAAAEAERLPGEAVVGRTLAIAGAAVNTERLPGEAVIGRTLAVAVADGPIGLDKGEV